jgi:CRISPR/Cas system-associated exonuclease Cas4 (RecB family)
VAYYELSTSEIKARLQCPAQHARAYREGIKLALPRTALFTGRGIHTGLEAYHDSYGLPQDERVAIALESFLADHDKQMQEIWSHNESLPDVKLREYEAARELGVAMLEGYAAWEVNEPQLGLLKVDHTEEQFKVRVPGKRAYFVGKRDGRTEINGELWLVENKSAKSVGDSYIEALALDLQVTGYTWAAEQELNRPVAGVVYNILRKQLPGPRVSAPLFYRVLVRRNETELARFAHDLPLYLDECRRGRVYIAPSMMTCNGCAYRELCVNDNPMTRAKYVNKAAKHEELEGEEAA